MSDSFIVAFIGVLVLGDFSSKFIEERLWSQNLKAGSAVHCALDTLDFIDASSPAPSGLL